MVKLKLFLLFYVLSNFCFATGTLNKILLTIYYESKCPDSKDFILKQLQPTMQSLHKYVKLQFVPFGKSQSIDYGDGGFVCQHGSAECLGNIIQDCALNLMREDSDLKKVAYVSCEMSTEAGANGILDCVSSIGLPVIEVEQCALSNTGISLQLESEYLTSLVRPKFVPTVTINREFNQEVQDRAQTDLLGTLCSILTETPPCAQYYNNIALKHLLHTSPYSYHKIKYQ